MPATWGACPSPTEAQGPAPSGRSGLGGSRNSALRRPGGVEASKGPSTPPPASPPPPACPQHPWCRPFCSLRPHLPTFPLCPAPAQPEAPPSRPCLPRGRGWLHASGPAPGWDAFSPPLVRTCRGLLCTGLATSRPEEDCLRSDSAGVTPAVLGWACWPQSPGPSQGRRPSHTWRSVRPGRVRAAGARQSEHHTGAAGKRPVLPAPEGPGPAGQGPPAAWNPQVTRDLSACSGGVGHIGPTPTSLARPSTDVGPGGGVGGGIDVFLLPLSIRPSAAFRSPGPGSPCIRSAAPSPGAQGGSFCVAHLFTCVRPRLSRRRGAAWEGVGSQKHSLPSHLPEAPGHAFPRSQPSRFQSLSSLLCPATVQGAPPAPHRVILP